MPSLSHTTTSTSGSNVSRRRSRLAKRRGRLVFVPAIVNLEDRIMLTTDFWTGTSASSGGNDNWSTGGNWSLGTAPGVNDTADFTSSQSHFGTANVDTQPTVRSVVIDASWFGTLNVSASLTVTGDFSLASGNLSGNGTVLVSGSGSTWTGGVLGANFTNAGTLTVSGTANVGLTGILNNTGTIVYSDTGSLFANANNTTINNEGGATFDIQTDASIFNNGQSNTTFNNHGLLKKSVGNSNTSSQISFAVNNAGAIAGNAGTLEIENGGSGTNNDTVNANGGTVALFGSFTGTFAGSGTGAVELGNRNGSFAAAGTNGVTLNFTGSVLQWNQGTLSGSITNAGTMTTSGNGGLGLAGTLNNTGTITYTDTSSLLANASGTTINNAVGATFDIQTDAGIFSNGQSNTAFNNAGQLKKSVGASNNSSQITFPVSNSGTIAGNAGTLKLTGGGTGSGADTVTAAGGTVVLSGNFSGNFAGSGSSGGSVQLADFIATGSGVTLNFAGSVLEWTAVDSSLGGTINNVGTFTFATTFGLALTGTLTNTGTIIVTGGSSVNANAANTTIDNQAGAVFDFQDAASVSANNQTNAVFNNLGTLERTAGTSTGTATVSFLVNNSGTIAGNAGTLKLTGGGSGIGNDTVTAGSAGTVILSGNYSGSLAGSGAAGGSIQLADFAGTGSGVTLNFAGSVLEWTAVDSSLSGTINNVGTFTFATNFGLALTGTLTNTGTIIVTGGSSVNANAANTTINNQAGAVFDFQGPATLSANNETNAVFNNLGTVERSTGTGTATLSFLVNNSGTIAGNSATLQLTGGGTGIGTDTINAGNVSTVILSGNFSGNFTGSALLEGSVQLNNFTAVGNGATLNFAPGALQWSAVDSNLEGTIINAGSLNIIENFGLSIGGNLTNTGTINLTGTSLLGALADGTTINNAAGAVFNFQTGATLSANGKNNTAFNNAGTLIVSAGSATATLAFPLTNTGLIRADSGTLDVSAGGSESNSANITAATGASVVFTGAYSGTFAGSGSGSVQLTNFNAAGTGATFNFPGSVLQVSAGSLSGTITNAGKMTVSGNVSLTGTLSNAGTLNMKGNAAIFAEAASTTINNETGATFNMQAGTNISRNSQSNAAFNNNGTLDLSGGNVQSEISFPMGGAGNVVITNGFVTLDSGTLEFDNSELLVVEPSATLNFGGNLTGTTQNRSQFAPIGSVQFDGSGTAAAPQTLEVMSQDLGNVAAGFQHNFAYGALTISNSTYVRLMDSSPNIAGGTQPNALYANSIVVGAGSTLDLHGLNVYARQLQVNGTVVNGTIHQLPAAGPLNLNSPAPGTINDPAQVDDWTFYGQAGQTVDVAVSTGAFGAIRVPQPTLDYAQVQVLDPSGHVVASGSNTQQDADITLTGIALAANGTYHVQVQAQANLASIPGNYVVTEWDGNAHPNALNLNENQNGQLSSPYAADHWTFSAPANEAVQFNLLSVSSAAIEFDLTGPNGFTAFSNSTTGSGLITLPSAGVYTLTAHLSADQPGAYAFNVSAGNTTNLAPGTPHQGTLSGNGQEQLFTVTLASPAALSIALTDSNAQDQNELYVYKGQAPTRVAFQYSANGVGANQSLALAAQAGTYYILVYNNLVNAPGSHYTLDVEAPAFAWTGLTPGKVSRDEVVNVFATGIFPLAYQSSTAYQIQFISAGGTVFPSTPLYLAPTSLGFHPGAILPSGNSQPSLSASLPANSLPAGTYSVKIIDSAGHSQTMPNALTSIQGGTGILHTEIIVPNPVGYHQPTTLYVQYTNTGTAPMAPPLLVLTATQKGQEGAFLSLDPTLAGLGYTSDNTPAGFSQAVQFVANGSVPGILEPGETETVPIYDGGWLHSQWDFSRPPIIFSVGQLDTTNSTTIDWSSMEASMRPGTINTTAWNAIFPVLTANLGSTWGQYLQTLDNDAYYLASLGESTDNLNDLLAFEIEKANAGYIGHTLVSVSPDALPAPGLPLTFQQSFQGSISGRYTKGILGLGWTTTWDIAATTMTNGDVVIENDGIPTYFTLKPDGTFAPQAGDEATKLTETSGALRLVLADSTTYQFNANGSLDYVEDTHGNRISANYNAQGLLSSLTQSNGEFFQLEYNSSGLLSSLTDSNGKTEIYLYDSSQHLNSYSDAYGTTTYSYITGQSAAQDNALSEIAYANATDIFFGYDTQGRLIDEHSDAGAEDESISYGPVGGYTTTDADGNQTTTLFNLFGATAESVDPLGNVTRYFYDTNLDLTEIVSADGTTQSYTYNSNGDRVSATDPLGLTTTFQYDNNNNLTSYTDPKGNETGYVHDSQNDLLSITLANGAKQQFTYDPLGDATQYVDANGQAISSTYNADGLITRDTFADGTSYMYTYGDRGNLLTATDSGGATTFSYTNPANPDLLMKVTYSDGKFLDFSYNAVGERTQEVDQTGFAVNYSYDSLGRLSELTDTSGNMIAKYIYDAAGYLTQKDMGNGTRTIYTYYGNGNVRSISNFAPDHVTINSFDDYTYDNVADELSDTNQDGQWRYTYDADSELTGAVFTPNNSDPDHLSAQQLQYVYDTAGNRISATVNGVTTNYAVNNVNEYTSSTTNGIVTNYGYDANGNLVSQIAPNGTTNFQFNELNKLTAVNGPGLSAAYGYNALGARTSQTLNGVTTEFENDPTIGGLPVASFGTGGGLLAHYTYGLGLTSQVSSNGSPGYYDFNNIGSTVGITGSSGSYVNQYSYLPYGRVVTSTASLPNPFTYVGQLGVVDDGSGTLAMGARQFDASTGQFLSDDPLGLAGGGINLRTYALNNPVQLADPTGLSFMQFDRDLNDFKAIRAKKGLSWLPIKLCTYPVELAERAVAGIWNIGHNLLEVTALSAGGAGTGAAGYGAAVGIAYLAPVAAASGFGAGVTLGMASAFGGVGGLGGAAAYFWVKGAWEPPNDPVGGSGCILCDILSTILTLLPPVAPSGAPITTTTTPVTSEDPNSMIGPTGYGTGNFVLPQALLPYEIEFENDPTATAPAQRVDITDQLDPNLDWSTLQLAAAGFGNTYIPIPAGLRNYETTVNTTENGQAFEVLVKLILNPATGVLSASYQSIDSTTGLPPANLLTGFLPPEPADGSNNSGIGFVSFTINPKAGLATGTQIRNVADISFDLAQIITTDQKNDQDPTQGIDPTKQTLVSIDATPPTSSVNALSAVTKSTSVSVSWAGTDGAGPGIAGYDVYVRDNNGPFTLFQTNTTATSATYTGQFGHTYGFYSVATDFVGLAQPTPGGPQATTTLVAPPTSTVSPLTSPSLTPSFTVSWSGTPGQGASSIASYTIYDSDNSGPFTAFLTNTSLTSTTFNGQAGHIYGFYSVATDNLGSTQPIPGGAQATMTVASPPTSTVSSLPAATTNTTFTVRWSGTPGVAASSITSYNVFFDEDGSATFSPFQTATNATSAPFTGQLGHRYGFYSVATNNLGLVQPTPNGAQATVTVAGLPTSTVSPLPSTSRTTHFTVSWSGTPGQGASSITSYEIFFSVNGGAFTPFLAHTTATSAPFTGQARDTYRFYSVATDNLGDTQPTPSSAQATTTVVATLTLGDFNGDRKTDTAIYDQTTSQFFVLFSGGGAETPLFGNPAHVNIPVAGDFDGDGKADTAIYDQTSSTFYILLSGGGAIVRAFGDASHVNIPISGDFDGDGKTDLAIYDQTASRFFVLYSGGGAETPFFGNPADTNVPVAGDFDGDGKADLAIYDQTISRFFVLYSGGGAQTPFFGDPSHTNVPIAGDFDGDGKADLAIYDQTISRFFVLYSGGGAETPFFGNPAHVNVPVAGDYDGDGKTDVGVYDQTSSQFFVLFSGGGAETPLFGNPSHVNVPLPSVYLPGRLGRSVAESRSQSGGQSSFDFAASANSLASGPALAPVSLSQRIVPGPSKRGVNGTERSERPSHSAIAPLAQRPVQEIAKFEAWAPFLSPSRRHIAPGIGATKRRG
jgi:RHS repeat-associated protein